ncbi:MAG TPA: SDR family oxidoreductase [Methylomirabilota bacterium]|nr:SDR family oxidoreductase [Methylomirabilota bacterium]
MDLQLRDKVVLITGGASGIGLATAEVFIEEGARVAIIDKDTARIDALRARFPQILAIAGDLRDPAVCQQAVHQTLTHFSQLDILVNNAGVNDGVGLDATPQAFLESLTLNLVPAFAVTHFALEALKRARGSIINVSSKVAETGQGNTSGYAAAKGGINALTREWAVALAPFGVRVNCVVPAECDTPQYQKWFATQPDPTLARQQIEALVPLGHRLTAPSEIASVIAFLASERSSHTTAQILHIDGGYTHLDRSATARRAPWQG